MGITLSQVNKHFVSRVTPVQISQCVLILSFFGDAPNFNVGLGLTEDIFKLLQMCDWL